jgi:hypothetical protein
VTAMSRTNKPRRRYHPRRGGSHHYSSLYLHEPKQTGNRWMRQNVKQRMKDVPFTDDFDERRLPARRADLFERWQYD